MLAHATARASRLWVVNGESESSSFAAVMLEHPTETLLAFDLPYHGRFFRRLNRRVAGAARRDAVTSKNSDDVE